MIDAGSFVDEFVAAIRSEDADRYASLYAEDAVMIEPLLGEPLHGQDAIRAGGPPCSTLSERSTQTSLRSSPMVGGLQ